MDMIETIAVGCYVMQRGVGSNGKPKLESDHAVPSVKMDMRVMRTLEKMRVEFRPYATVELTKVLVEKGRSTFYLIMDVHFDDKAQYHKMKLASPDALNTLRRFIDKYKLIQDEFALLVRSKIIEREGYEIDVRTAYLDLDDDFEGWVKV